MTAQIAVGYARISIATSETDMNSLALQRAAITRYCAAYSLDLADILTDDGVSGAVAIGQRPAGKLACERVVAEKAVLVVSKLDRAFRSVLDFSSTSEQLERAGASLVSIGEGFDLRTHYGRAMAQIAVVFAELERCLIRERIQTSVKARRAAGRKIAGQAPYGYRYESDGPRGVNMDVHEVLRPCPEEILVIGKMLTWRRDGKSFQEIADKLNEAGTLARGGGPWAKSSVHAICEEGRARLKRCETKETL